MTIPQVIAVAFLAFLNGFAIGVVLYRHYVMKPRWETEAELRKELKQAREDLYLAKHGRPVDQLGSFLRAIGAVSNERPAEKYQHGAFGWYVPPAKPNVVFTPAIKTRAHSDVLPFDSIDDLIRPHPEDLLK